MYLFTARGTLKIHAYLDTPEMCTCQSPHVCLLARVLFIDIASLLPTSGHHCNAVRIPYNAKYGDDKNNYMVNLSTLLPHFTRRYKKSYRVVRNELLLGLEGLILLQLRVVFAGRLLLQRTRLPEVRFQLVVVLVLVLLRGCRNNGVVSVSNVRYVLHGQLGHH